jgi:hypothetical protein
MPPTLRDLPTLNVRHDHRELIAHNLRRHLDFVRQPELLYPWWHRCTTTVLIVTDGSLDFGDGDFGLSTFLRTLRDHPPGYTRFDVTIGHISNVTNARMFGTEAGVVRRIKSFRFDDASHFTPDMYDQVWLFGIASTYNTANPPAGRENTSGLLADEVAKIQQHMERGGGLFATGDHGTLGKALCGALPRVRSMRHWDHFPSSSETVSEVGMNGPRRNDTNQIGHDPGSQFSDQSDDIPQRLDLKLYSTWAGALRTARYPHPIFCGRNGRIDVFPDHPHEGECREPTRFIATLNGALDYPAGSDGQPVKPEIIATGRVVAGNNARGSKTPTQAHTFGVACAYDGHRVADRARGRVVCDSTWHHYVNVNLVGVVEGGFFDEFDEALAAGTPDHPSKHDGFLSSTAGRAVLAKIQNHYTNVAVWISPPERIACYHRALWRQLAFHDRITEATLFNPDITLEKIPVAVLSQIGAHARDVLGRRTSVCQTLEWELGWLKEFRLIEKVWIDPWDPITRLPDEVNEDLPLPVFDANAMFDAALGGALVAMRQACPEPPDEFDERLDKKLHSARMEGAQWAMKQAREHVSALAKDFIAHFT